MTWRHSFILKNAISVKFLHLLPCVVDSAFPQKSNQSTDHEREPEDVEEAQDSQEGRAEVDLDLELGHFRWVSLFADVEDQLTEVEDSCVAPCYHHYEKNYGGHLFVHSGGHEFDKVERNV